MSTQSTGCRHIPLTIGGAALATTVIVTLAGTTGAVAGSLITGKQIKDGTVTSADIKNKSLKTADLAPATVQSLRGKTGPTGPAGAAGPAGANGTTGPAGDKGPRGLSAWDTIPSGVSVSGEFRTLERGSEVLSQPRGELLVELPGRASAPLGGADLKFANHSHADPAQVDPSCSGTMQAPTAPPGKVCIYLDPSNITPAEVTAEHAQLQDLGFALTWRPHSTEYGTRVAGTWAYTAP